MKITSSTTFIELFDNKKISKELYNCMKYRKLKTILDAYKFFEKKDSQLLDKIREELDSLFYIVVAHDKKDVVELEREAKSKRNYYNYKDCHIDDAITLKKMNADGIVSNRLYNCLTKCNFNYFREVVDYIQNINDIDEFLHIRGFGVTCLAELKKLLSLSCVKNIMPSELSDLKIGNNNNYESSSSFYERYELICDNELYTNEINIFYEELKLKSSGRVRSFLNENFPTFNDALRLYFGEKEVRYDNSKCGKKSVDEINNITFSLYNYICELFTMDIDTHLKNVYKREYPFLSNKDIDFLFSYYKDNLSLPMFYILYKSLIVSHNRFEKVFCIYNGISCDSNTQRGVADIYGVSVETIRNILRSKDVEYPQIIKNKAWEKYCHVLNQIVYEENSDFKEIVKNENLPISFSEFISLCSLISEIEAFVVNGKKYYVSNEFLDCFDLKNSIRDIKNTMIQKRTEDTCIPISIFIDTYVIKKPNFDTAIISNLLKTILHESYGLSIVGNNVFIEKNCLDRKIEIFNIIKENNAPMHINDIRLKLMEYSEFSNVTIEQIRSDIQRHPNIKSIGKKSTYTIDTWNVYTGTIGNLLYEVLNSNDIPMSIMDLYDMIALRFPSTTEKSISSLLYLDDRFVRYEGNMYGISGRQYPDEYKICTHIRCRASFEERCDKYEKFIISHHHSPQANGTEEEQSLLRWFRNVSEGRIDITKEQLKRFNGMIQKYDDYIMSGEEYSYYRFVKEFEMFIDENYRFPTENDDEEKRMYKWFYRQMNRYKSYQDKRKVYFEKLLLILEEYGFVFE